MKRMLMLNTLPLVNFEGDTGNKKRRKPNSI
ncbi:hypothetical protein BN1080_01703 [Planococcus massiliensis]|uniref:Uncharacterized protein n=1 Tax=Planococcus massiliensis TaxID=1499687 RepID=A0A098EKB5_9BACL|nr:hypothetical protein BN1080_01703 [Planococcus massiliensis]